MPYRPHSHAKVDPSAPRAWGVCDRCASTYQHQELRWQHDFQGANLINRRLLVCQNCLDEPQNQGRPIRLPPDPVPIKNPRPLNYSDTGDNPDVDWPDEPRPTGYIEVE